MACVGLLNQVRENEERALLYETVTALGFITQARENEANDLFDSIST